MKHQGCFFDPFASNLADARDHTVNVLVARNCLNSQASATSGRIWAKKYQYLGWAKIRHCLARYLALFDLRVLSRRTGHGAAMVPPSFGNARLVIAADIRGVVVLTSSLVAIAQRDGVPSTRVEPTAPAPPEKPWRRKGAMGDILRQRTGRPGGIRRTRRLRTSKVPCDSSRPFLIHF